MEKIDQLCIQTFYFIVSLLVFWTFLIPNKVVPTPTLLSVAENIYWKIDPIARSKFCIFLF